MSAICNAEVPRPSQYRRDIPPQLEQIMLKALARDPGRRFQSAGDMSIELDKVASSVGVGATTTALASYMRLQFGDQKEPWLQQTKEDTDEEDNDPTQVDFDGPASGLAPPPSESIQKLAIPKVIDASKGSPIAQARTSALTPSAPSLRAQLPVPRPKGPPPPPQPPPLPPVPVVEDTGERARTNVKRVPSHPVDAHAPTDLVETLPRLQTPPRDATALVTPLTAYESYRVPQRRASGAIWWVLAAMLIAGAAVGAFVLWPVAGVREPEVLAQEPPPAEEPPPPAEEKAEEKIEEQAPPGEPDARSGIQMTMRDYEEAKQKEAEQTAAREADKAALAAAAELERQAAEEKNQRAAEEKERERTAEAEQEAAKEPVAKKPAPTKRTTAKAPAKRTVSKAAKTPAKKRTQTKAKAKAKAKPTWDPDNLFLDEK
jgi:chemotaxis protein histidine kinase CheA